jgi:hypothetical protein
VCAVAYPALRFFLSERSPERLDQEQARAAFVFQACVIPLQGLWLACRMNEFVPRHADEFEKMMKHPRHRMHEHPASQVIQSFKDLALPELGVRMHVELGANCPR